MIRNGAWVKKRDKETIRSERNLKNKDKSETMELNKKRKMARWKITIYNENK